MRDNATPTISHVELLHGNEIGAEADGTHHNGHPTCRGCVQLREEITTRTILHAHLHTTGSEVKSTEMEADLPQTSSQSRYDDGGSNSAPYIVELTAICYA